MESASGPPAACNIGQVSGDHNTRCTGMLMTAYNATIAYIVQTTRVRFRRADSKAAKTSTTAASCHKYATGDHHVIVTRCPTDPNALLIANTISRLIAFIGIQGLRASAAARRRCGLYLAFARSSREP